MDDDDGLMVNFSTAGSGADLDTLLRSRAAPKREKHSTKKPKTSEKKRTKPQLGQGQAKRARVDEGKTKPVQTSGPPGKREVVSSLFSYNPEIPAIEVKQEAAARPAEDKTLFAESTFASLKVDDRLCKCLEEQMHLERPTEVQKRAVPAIRSGSDVMIRSQTGSGKTLAYALPILDTLMGFDNKVTRTDGVQAVILAPTRELALQIMDVLHKLTQMCASIVPGCVIGGEKKKSEKARLRRGINLLVATPGRLVDHLRTTACLNVSHCRVLVLDEADRLMDLGFEKDITIIINALNGHHPNFIEKDKAEHKEEEIENGILPPKPVRDRFIAGKQLHRQNILVSATLNSKVKSLAKLSLQKPLTIAVDSRSDNIRKAVEEVKAAVGTSADTTDEVQYNTPVRLSQTYLCVPPKLRLVALAGVLRKECVGKHGEAIGKAILFMSTCDTVDFYYELLRRFSSGCNDDLKQDLAVFGELPITRLHGNMPQQERKDGYKKFCDAKAGLLICTDVAARGLHLPHVNLIIQYTVPAELADYVHRVGRTARIGSSGKALLFLLPSEIDYIKMLKGHGIDAEALDYNAFLSVLVDHAKAAYNADLSLTQQPVRNADDAATQVQLEFEEALKSDKELQVLGKTAFTSFVRGYATYPRDMKQFMHIKNVHMGHLAKSFAMRDDPTAIARATAKESAKVKKRDERAEKRDRGQNNKSSRGQTTVVSGQRTKSYTSKVPSLLGIDRAKLARKPIGPQ